MLKNRSLQVKWVKTPKDADPNAPAETVEETVIHITDSAKELMHEGMKIVAFYVALDTARKVLITLANK